MHVCPASRSTIRCSAASTALPSHGYTAIARNVLHVTRRAGMRCNPACNLLHHAQSSQQRQPCCLPRYSPALATHQRQTCSRCFKCHARGATQAAATLCKRVPRSSWQTCSATGLPMQTRYLRSSIAGAAKCRAMGRNAHPRCVPVFTPLLIPPKITQGKCTFGPRLSDEEIQSLAAYILQQAEAGWTSGG